MKCLNYFVNAAGWESDCQIHRCYFFSQSFLYLYMHIILIGKLLYFWPKYLHHLLKTINDHKINLSTIVHVHIWLARFWPNTFDVFPGHALLSRKRFSLVQFHSVPTSEQFSLITVHSCYTTKNEHVKNKYYLLQKKR